MSLLLKANKILSVKCERAYAVQHMKLNDTDFMIYASEARPNEPGICIAYDINNLSKEYKIWDNVGGCMGFVADPFNKNAFYAVQEFYLKEVPSKAKVVHVAFDNEKFTVSDYLSLPLVHRIGVLGKYLICCTVSKYKANKDDWSNPGEVLAFDLTNCNNKQIIIANNLYRNHGFYQTREAIYIGSDNGLFKLTLENDNFSLVKLLSGKIGDVCVCDIDMDGQNELITIKEMHGNCIDIYHINNGTYWKQYSFNENIEFVHAFTKGEIDKKNVVFIGVRKGNANTLLLQHDYDGYHMNSLDESVGAANLSFVNINNKNYLGAANHTLGEFALYDLKMNE